MTKAPTTADNIILQLPILVKIKNNPANKIKNVDVSPTEPGINP